MKTRQIHKDFWTSESIAELDHFSRLLFIGIWGIADRKGLVLYRPKQISVQIFPYETAKPDKIQKSISKMLELGMVIILDAKNGDGSTCIKVVNFNEYQNIHRNEAQSKLECRYITSNVDTLRGIPGSYTSTYTSTCTSTFTCPENPKADFPDPVHKSAKLLAQLMLDNDPQARLPKTEKQKLTWLKDLDKISRLDGRAHDEIDDVIRWSQQDEFWKSNILSPAKLRKQFPKLRLAMRRPREMSVEEHNRAVLAQALKDEEQCEI